MKSIGSVRSCALWFVCFLAAGLLLSRPAIDAPFFWDDLHLIRVHTPEQLASVWSGTWDTDHIETPGFRPLTAYFNHLRALALGESVRGQRTFLVVLFAVYLTMASLLARQYFAAPFWQALLGGLLTLFHMANAYQYAWISDGVHLLSGLLMLGAILTFLRAWSSGGWRWLLTSLLCVAAALLTREDALTIYPLLLWFGAACVWLMDRSPGPKGLLTRTLAVFGAILLSVLGAYWYLRAAAIPNAASVRIDIGALLWAINQTIQDAGDWQTLAFSWPKYELMIWVWQAWLVGITIVGLVSLKESQRRIALIWAGALLISALPALVAARSNLLLLPVTFWGFLIAQVLAQFWRQSRAIGLRALASGMILFALAAPAYGSVIFQQQLRPNNLVLMCRNAWLLYGLSGPVTIPPARRESVQEQLKAYGISDVSDFEARWPTMEHNALADGRFADNSKALPFVPMFQFLPQFGLHPRCEPPK